MTGFSIKQFYLKWGMVLSAVLMCSDAFSATYEIQQNPVSTRKNGVERVVTVLVTSGVACNIQSDFTASALNGLVTETFNGCAGCLNVGMACGLGYTPVAGQGPIGATTFNLTANAGADNIPQQLAILDIGSLWNGGLVFEINDTGSQGKVVTASDNSTSLRWGINEAVSGINENSTDSPTSCSGSTNGNCNTTRIVNQFTGTDGIPSSTYAAGVCSDLSVNASGNSCVFPATCFSDWALPSIGELQSVWSQTTFNGGALTGFSGDFYWSSTQLSVSPVFYAWVRNFSRACQGADKKTTPHHVRCISGFLS